MVSWDFNDFIRFCPLLTSWNNPEPQDGKQFGVILFASIAMILGVAKTFRIHKNIETVARCVTQTLVRKVDAKAWRFPKFRSLEDGWATHRKVGNLVRYRKIEGSRLVLATQDQEGAIPCSSLHSIACLSEGMVLLKMFCNVLYTAFLQKGVRLS